VQAQAAYNAAAKHLESVRSVSRDAALKSAEGQLNSAEGKYKGAMAQVSYSEISQPYRWRGDRPSALCRRNRGRGHAADHGDGYFEPAGQDPLAQSLAQRLKLGDEASVAVPGVGDPVPAKIALISPALDPGSTTVEVWLKIENKAGSFKVGTPVKVSITGRTDAKAWKIPATSVLTAQDGTKSVMVVGTDGAAHKKTVTIGLEDAKDVQVTSGLAPATW